MRRFHGAAERTFTATPTLAAELHEHGLRDTHHWPRGVDLEQFHPGVPPHPALARLQRPILLNVGRVALEKNIQAFLDAGSRGRRWWSATGRHWPQLKLRYPEVLFLGAKHGAELASTYAAADVFVFPSRTDTFGLVNIEALACESAGRGLPGRRARSTSSDRRSAECMAASGAIGALDEDLGQAIARALNSPTATAAAEERPIIAGIAARTGSSRACRGCRRRSISPSRSRTIDSARQLAR